MRESHRHSSARNSEDRITGEARAFPRRPAERSEAKDSSQTHGHPEEEGPRVAILSHGLWQRRFGAQDNVIGRAIVINGSSYTVVGVMPAGFSHLYVTPYDKVPELWLSGIALSPAH